MNTTQIHNYWFSLLRVFLVFTMAALMSGVPTGPGAVEPPLPRYASGQVDISNPDRVDVALVLAVDVSSSIKSAERRFQREAYAQALSDPRVARMALGGGSGRIAIAYMEWSGSSFQRIHLPMRIMSSPAELARFAADILEISDHPADPMYVQPTAVGNALLVAEQAMAALAVPARDYVIDISGDGVVNDGAAVVAVRDQLLAMGLTVNGLPIEVSHAAPDFEDTSLQEVARFYADCVIGGPGSFHVVARGFGDVRETLIMKLMLEMASMPAREKQRLAQAWNRGDGSNTARIVPATVLQLAPNRQTAPRPQSNCGENRYGSNNPFQIIP